jgi:chromosome segregation ATPase
MPFTGKDIKELESDVKRLDKEIDDKLKDMAVIQKDFEKKGVKGVPDKSDITKCQKDCEKAAKLVKDLDPTSKESEFDKASDAVKDLEKAFKKASTESDKEVQKEKKELDK